MNRRLVATALAAASLFAADAAVGAPSDVRYTGQTSKNKAVELQSDSAGTLKTMSLDWITRDCGKAKYYRERTTVSFSGTPGARSFELGGASRATLDDGFTAKVRIGGHGKLSRSGALWSGTWSARVRIDYEGEPYDRCRLRPLRWSAAIVYGDRVAAGTFSFVSPEGEFIGQGESRSYVAPETPIVLERPSDGFETGFFFEVDGWSGSFGNSEPLQPGTYANATSEDLPLMYFHGNGNSCGDDNHGEFTVERYRVRGGDLMAVALTFTQACADDLPLTADLDVRMVPPPFGALSRARLEPMAHRVLAHGSRLGELP